jgi:predicted GNAT family acetyltransferase
VDVRVADNPAEGRFEIFADGKLAGFTRYRASRGHVTFWHTEVDPAFAGLGLGGRLAQGALEAVVAQGKQIVPLCPFITAHIRRHPELLGAIVPAVRQRLAAELRAS